MKTRWDEVTNVDVRLTHEAAQHSVRASNLENPLLALMEVQAAYRTLDVLIRRYGPRKASEITGLDVEAMFQTVRHQRERILQDVTDDHPELIPQGDLLKYTNFVREREASQQNGVLHLDEEHELPKL